MLDATESAIRQLRPTLDQLDPLAARLRPGARELQPAATAARAALQQANTLLDRATPLLRGLGPAISELDAASRAGIPLIAQLTPSIERLNDKIIPSLDRTDPTTGLKSYEEIGPTFSAASDAASLFTPSGHFFLFPDSGDARSIGASPCTFNPGDQQAIVCEDLKQILEDLLGGGKQ